MAKGTNGNGKRPSIVTLFVRNIDDFLKSMDSLQNSLFSTTHSHKEKRSAKAGLPPGALVYVGKKRPTRIKITVIDYNEKKFQEKTVDDIKECFPFKDTPSITWINIDGIHDVKLIETIGKYFGVHPLILEDILNTNQRPKMQDMESYVYTVLRMFQYEKEKQKVMSEQVSLILGKNFVISFQETDDWDVFDPIRQRLRTGQGRIRKLGADYLTYSMIDAITDNYFTILENVGEKIETLHMELLENPKKETLHKLNIAKRELLELRKSIWPLREVVSQFERGETDLVKKTTYIYLRDVYDHIIQVIDQIETYREMLAGMLDIYLSSISNKLNEVMKVLTLISTIFMPLTFLAGVYGMNFHYLPELYWRPSYFIWWGLCAAIAISMIILFKKKKWL
jgi:magnesium transporter